MLEADCLEGGQVYCCGSIRYQATQEADKWLDKKRNRTSGGACKLASFDNHTYVQRLERKRERERERERERKKERRKEGDKEREEERERDGKRVRMEEREKEREHARDRETEGERKER